MHSLTVQETRSPKLNCHQGWLLLEALRGRLSDASSPRLVVAGSPRCSLACSSITPISASIITWLLLSGSL